MDSQMSSASSCVRQCRHGQPSWAYCQMFDEMVRPSRTCCTCHRYASGTEPTSSAFSGKSIQMGAPQKSTCRTASRQRRYIATHDNCTAQSAVGSRLPSTRPRHAVDASHTSILANVCGVSHCRLVGISTGPYQCRYCKSAALAVELPRILSMQQLCCTRCRGPVQRPRACLRTCTLPASFLRGLAGRGSSIHRWHIYHYLLDV
mmetsp:Transcript_112045/g.327693  ORF Transcript_112045/g.327693 Transcript_112045/m.327693 type:complete len:204 (-) Transcript_112045:45-656(-)